MEQVKLIIWDLDETFWKGTLSETEVEFIQTNINLIRDLSHRGIINSVVSKNDFKAASSKLIEAGVWEYVVFPSISWQPKGQQVKMIIEECQLRPQNVLFIDDNVINLEEVAFYNPGIEVVEPSFIPQLLTHPALKGKNDKDLSRLKQYKLLEEKKVHRQAFSSNDEFLKNSEIRIRFDSDVAPARDRIIELINRSNQLNFTKNRITDEDFERMLSTDGYDQATVQVVDKFGDYGVVGYYCLDRHSNSLLQFVFSCRILNLGIEQYVYQKLGFPVLEIVQPVVSNLVKVPVQHWIKEMEASDVESHSRVALGKVILKGGCDLSQMTHYLSKSEVEILNEGNTVKDNIPLHSDHSQVILDSLRLTTNEKKYLSETLPFVDDTFYSTQIFDETYDLLVFSVLMDYTMDLYRHKEKGYEVPYGGYYDHLTDPKDHARLSASYEKRKMKSMNESFLKYFSDNYELIGQISPEAFLRNLTEIRRKVPGHVSIVFLNGAELDSPNDLEKNARQRHTAMNAVLDQFVKTHDKCYLIDVRKIVGDQNMLTNNLRHYRREVYFQLSVELKNLLTTQLGKAMEVQQVSAADWMMRDAKRYFNKLTRYLSPGK